MYYRQCTLEKGNQVQVSWLPEKFAVKNSIVKLKDNKTKEWDNGWTVVSVGTKLHEDFVPDPHEDIKAHRRATGDSLPKVKNENR
jgi:hypothetical protein